MCSSDLRWFLVKVLSKYYIVSYFGHFLTVSSPGNACDVDVNMFWDGDGILWKLRLYCLDVDHFVQEEHYTCGVACTRMVLSYYGIDTSTYTDDYLWSYGIYLLYGTWYTHGTSGIPSYGREMVAATVIHFLEGTDYEDAYSMDMLYISDNNQTIFDTVTENNISCGYPVIAQIKISSSSFPFTYTTSGHFVVVSGIYTDAEGTVRVVICDPHYNTEPGIASVYSVVDMPLNDFYPLATSIADTLIRHTD